MLTHQVFTGSSSARILLSVTSGDAAYAALSPPPIEVRIDDNDAARVVLDRSGLPEGGQLLRLVEGGGDAVLPVYLASRPVAGAAVRVRLLSGGQLALRPSELLFTAANFSTPVPVAVSAVDDAAIEAPLHYDDIGVLVSSSDPFYEGMQVPPPPESNVVAMSSSGRLPPLCSSPRHGTQPAPPPPTLCGAHRWRRCALRSRRTTRRTAART